VTSLLNFLLFNTFVFISLSVLDETYRAHLNEKQIILQNLESSLNSRELIQTKKPDLDARYKFYQEIRSYTFDIIDCFSEKIDEIDKIETKWMSLFKTRAQKIQTRRQEDIKDQNVEYSLKYSKDPQGIRKTMDPSHQRRAIERELRRKKRRETRINSMEVHYEGLSSDDDENQNDQGIFDQKRKDIIQNINEVFKDVIEDYCDIDFIKKRFEEWKILYTETYDDAYVSLSLVKLFSLLVRHDILDWNPLELSSKPIEEFKWYKSLANFNLESKNDDDRLFMSRIIEKTIYQRLNLIIENIYDPFSAKQTKLLVNLIKNLVTKYPSLSVDSQNTKKIIESIVVRIRTAFDNDIFVPLFPKYVLENVDCPSRAFFYHQFWSCVKLFGNIITWNDLMCEKTTQELSLDLLLNRYVMVALQCMEMNTELVNKTDYIVEKLPQAWFKSNDEQTITQLNNLCRLLRRISDKINQDLKENKLSDKEFKDQIRSIRRIFVRIKAMNHAIELTNTFEVK
jgi:GC-rich sequence DNA-binding factor